MRVAVLGAGLQGMCVALEFALRHVDVDVFDRETEVVSQASLQTEGKIHMGFVFANDASFATARLMAQGATVFGPLLRRWVGEDDGFLATGPAFEYLVHRDSLLGPDELEPRYAAIETLCGDAFAPVGGKYLGQRLQSRVSRLSDAAFRSRYDDRHSIAAFRTPELGIDPQEIAAKLRIRAREEPRLRLRLSAQVTGATRDADGASVSFREADVERCETYDHVVNALWDGRLSIDASAGVPLQRPWSFRRKFFLRVPAPDVPLDVASTTTVLGPFGDVVRYASGDLHLSWYPVGRVQWSEDIEPPPRTLTAVEEDDLARKTFAAVSGIVPALSSIGEEAFGRSRVLGGIVYALGDTDVDVRTSLLHERWRTGPRSFGRYHTVDTGKYTTAPLFAKRLVDEIMGELS